MEINRESDAWAAAPFWVKLSCVYIKKTEDLSSWGIASVFVGLGLGLGCFFDPFYALPMAVALFGAYQYKAAETWFLNNDLKAK